MRARQLWGQGGGRREGTVLLAADTQPRGADRTGAPHKDARWAAQELCHPEVI